MARDFDRPEFPDHETADDPPHWHTYPVAGRTHVTEGYACWCGPTVQEICPECEDDPVEGRDGCYRCGGEGWITCTAPDLYDGPVGLLIIHNA